MAECISSASTRAPNRQRAQTTSPRQTAQSSRKPQVDPHRGQPIARMPGSRSRDALEKSTALVWSLIAMTVAPCSPGSGQGSNILVSKASTIAVANAIQSRIPSLLIATSGRDHSTRLDRLGCMGRAKERSALRTARYNQEKDFTTKIVMFPDSRRKVASLVRVLLSITSGPTVSRAVESVYRCEAEEIVV